MTYSHVLWDFNGTLLDDVNVCMESVNLLLSRRGLPILRSREEYQSHFRFPIEDYYAHVGFDFTKDPYPVLAHEWIAEYRAREQTAPLCPGAEEALRYVKALGITQVLFSATERKMLEEQAVGLGIRQYFDHIVGNDNIYAEGKIAQGKWWMERIRPEKALLIGDTVHDAAAANAMGIDCILVAAGHQSRQTLEGTGYPVVADLHEFAKKKMLE